MERRVAKLPRKEGHSIRTVSTPRKNMEAFKYGCIVDGENLGCFALLCR